MTRIDFRVPEKTKQPRRRVLRNLALMTLVLSLASGIAVGPDFAAGLGPSFGSERAFAASGSQVAIEIDTVGGFVAPGYQVGTLPNVKAYASGTVFKRDDSSNMGNAHRALKLRVNASSLKHHVEAIFAASKTPKHGWGFPGVADVPSTQIRIHAFGLNLNRSVYALSFTNGNLSAAQKSARLKLWNSVKAFTNWVNRQRATIYNPSVYELWTLAPKFDNGGVGIANPASVFCKSMGGTTEILPSEAGDVSSCALPDGTRIDEWQYFREESAKLGVWPSGVKVPEPDSANQNAFGGGCVPVAASKVNKLLKLEAGPWLLSSGQAIRVSLRPVLPSEVACHRVG